MKDRRQKALEILEQVNKAITGKENITKEILIAMLAEGHILLEDIPGVGKTSTALAFARATDLLFGRVQFTPDVMPSDLTGFSVYRRETESFVYNEGAVFCNLFLADEINRTSPKTQSALLEVMAEGKVTAEGVTRQVPKPFTVIATHNPSGSTGTQPLPESQLDRFTVGMHMGYPDEESELKIISTGGAKLERVSKVASAEDMIAMQEEVKTVALNENVAKYLLALIRQTREHPQISLGASPRAALALAAVSRACAYLDGRDFVIPEDVSQQFTYVIAHRLILSRGADMEGLSARELCKNILESVPYPRVGD